MRKMRKKMGSRNYLIKDKQKRKNLASLEMTQIEYSISNNGLRQIDLYILNQTSQFFKKVL